MVTEHHDFKMLAEDKLSVDLIEAQYALKNTIATSKAKSLVILVSGIELAGKGEAVKQLREWMDPRYLKVKADMPYAFSDRYPFWQPYAEYMPAEGQILVIFGNWYGDLLSSSMNEFLAVDEHLFDNYVNRMRAFEQDLKNNHVDVIKFWFDLSWKSLQKRLETMDPIEYRWNKLYGFDWCNKKLYDDFQRLRKRFTDDWLVIDGEKKAERDQQFAQHILRALRDCPEHLTQAQGQWDLAPIPAPLLHPSTDQMDKATYKRQLKKLSKKVANILRTDLRNVVVIFEGMDAAGKGGAIKRIVKNLDPREYEIYSISAPHKYELSRPYLWRFWSKLQPNEKITIFDRSWYGRVLVERIEGFASPVEWQRAYDEINRLEKDLYDHQTVVIKFWLAISKDEQEQRFKAREVTPHKRFKITEEDWRNRSHWDEYLQSAADMLVRTEQKYAPWHVIATNDKYQARVEVLRAILKQLKYSHR